MQYDSDWLAPNKRVSRKVKKKIICTNYKYNCASSYVVCNRNGATHRVATGVQDKLEVAQMKMNKRSYGYSLING